MRVFIVAVLFSFLLIACKMQPCLDKVCGEDRGEFCGDCGSGDYYCSKDHQCIIKTEAPECKEFDCGDTTVQTFFGDRTFPCGTCNDYAYCSPEQKCIGPKWAFSPGGEILDAPSIGDDGTIYAVFIASNTTLLCAINPDGTEKWRAPIKPYRGPAIIGEDGTLYVGSENGLSARDPENGAEKWNYSIAGYQHEASAIGLDGTIYAIDAATLYAINSNGTLRWTFVEEEISSFSFASELVLGSNDTVYACYENNAYNYGLLAIDKKGQRVWRQEAIHQEPCHHIIVGYNDVIYIGENNTLHAIGPDGSERWEGPFYYPSAISSDGTILASWADIFAVRPDGVLLWEIHEISDSLLLGNNDIAYNNWGHVQAFNGDGERLWSIENGGRISLVMDNSGMLYFSSDFSLVAQPSLSTGPADSPWPMYRADAKRTGRVH